MERIRKILYLSLSIVTIELLIFTLTAFPSDSSVKEKAPVSISGTVTAEIQYDKVSGKDQGRPEWIKERI